MLDTLIKNGIIIDGTGAKKYEGDIGLKDGKIVFVGSNCNEETKETIDAKGLTVTPGFIDFHSHSDYSLLVGTKSANVLQQGITTEITGHCGLSVLPLSDLALNDIKMFVGPECFDTITATPKKVSETIKHIEKDGLAANVAFFVGHGNVRGAVMGFDNRKPIDEELEKMKSLVREGMEAGALGLSSGLIYPPGAYAKEEELIELCKIVAEYDGMYVSHIRSEGIGVIESVKEAIRIGENAKIPVNISHHKIAGKQNWGKSKDTLKIIEEANERGMKVRCDQYPYKAGFTALINALPPKFAAEGRVRLLEKLKDVRIRQEMRQLLTKDSNDFENLIYGSGGLEGVLIIDAPFKDECRGKTLDQIAKELNNDPYDTMFDLIVDTKGNAMGCYFLMGDEDIERIMAHKYTMGGTDAMAADAREGKRLPDGHPRYTGTFIKILSEYVRDKKIVTLEEGIRKLTSMPADMAGFKTKGIIKEGYDADLVIMDYENLKATADFIQPNSPNEGVKYVFVNGKIAVKDDAATGVYAGKVVRSDK